MKTKGIEWAVCLGVVALAIGCDDDDTAWQDAGTTEDASADAGGHQDEDAGDDAGAELDLEIAGEYRYDIGGLVEVVITNSDWKETAPWGTSAYEIAAFANDEDWLVAENDPSNGYNPGKYSRFEWTYYEGSLYYCQQVLDGNSVEEARETGSPADATDPAMGGCGFPEQSFPWTMLVPASEWDAGAADAGTDAG